MEVDLKILKVKYLSNHLLDHTQILNLILDYQTIFIVRLGPYQNLKLGKGLDQSRTLNLH